MKHLLGLLLAVSSGFSQNLSYTFAQFDVPGATQTLATAINNNGQILGIYTDGRGSHCFLRSPDGATFTTFDPPGTNPLCSGLNNLGQAVGSFLDSGQPHGYIRDAAGRFTTFDIPAMGPGANAAAINDRGEIVGTLAAPPYGGPGYLRHPDGSLTNLTAPSIGDIAPGAINNQGDIAGWALTGSSQGTQHGFFRTADGIYRKFDLPGTVSFTRINAINNTGRFAGPGFVSNPDGTFTLLPYTVAGIDDFNRIVGTSFDGADHGFIGIPGPASTAPEIRTALPGVLPASAFGGSPINQTIASGTWIEIYGRNLSTSTRQWNASDFRNGVAPTSLDDVRVTVGGVPAFVSYVSPGQVNALLPSTVAPGSSQVVVTSGAQSTSAYTVQVAASRPAMLSLPPDISPQDAYVAALYPDFQTYALPPFPFFAGMPTRRARAGDTIVLFGMGFGPVSPDVPVGRAAPGPTVLTGQVEVRFNRSGTPVAGTVTYAGLVPGVVGLYQFNVIVPEVALLPGETTDDFVGVDVYLNGQHIPSPPSLRISLQQ